MGLTFHYSGKIRDYNRIDELTDEVADLCRELNWHFTLISDDKLKGIVLSAPESEPLWFMFTPNGKTCSVVNFQCWQPDDPFYSTIHVKTQYAGPEMHMIMIKMLRHISEKYFSEIEVSDEGEYWEKGDEENLRRIFGNYTEAINMFTQMLDGMQHIPGESPEELGARIEKMAKENFEGIEVVVVRNDQDDEETPSAARLPRLGGQVKDPVGGRANESD